MFFGLPGSGKSSFVCWRIFDELVKMDMGNSRYKRIYTNCPVNIPDDRVFVLPYTLMRSHDLLSGSLIIIDEAQMEFSDRSYKTFGKEDSLFFTQHRRFGYDVLVLTQKAGGVDKNVRLLSDSCYYIMKSRLFPWFSHVLPVGYGIYIPRRKDESSPHYGEIMEGYFRWTFMQRVFHTRFFRPVVYGFYDSFCRPPLPELDVDQIELAQSIELPDSPFLLSPFAKLSALITALKNKIKRVGE